jgi:hypothetical protein
MRAFAYSTIVAFLLWSVLSFIVVTPAHAQNIPALSAVPEDVPLEVRTHLVQRKQALEKELADFQAAAKVFNAKDAKDQGDAEYAALDAWRTRYINAAKAFNREVTEARERANKLRKPAPHVGAVAYYRGEFSIEKSDGSRLTNADMTAGSAVAVDLGARVTTGPTGRVQLLLLDETVFTIGPNSDIIIDEFVYDPDLTPRKIAVSLAKGIFRWVTGKVTPKDPTAMRVKTSAIAIGIRGTDFETLLEANGSGSVKLHEGMLEIIPTKGGNPFVMKEKSVVTFKPDGTVSQPEPIK